MPNRLDLRPLLAGVVEGLRNRRPHGDEPPDVRTRWVLVAVPVVAGGSIIGPRVVLSDAATLAEGAGLLVGAFLAGFAMIAMWRERLLARDRETEQASVRALREATAHVLVSVLVSMLVTSTLGAVANITVPPGSRDAAYWAAVILGGVGVAGLAYLVVTLVIVVNLLWDAYEAAGASTRTRR